MRLLTYEEIEKAGNNEIIPAFEGRIRKVFEQKQGKGQYGDWFLQNMVVANSSGTELQVVWGGIDTLNHLENKYVRFESVDTKHGLRGCTKSIRQGKDGKTYKEVKVTGAAKVIVDPEDRVANQPEQPTPQQLAGNSPLPFRPPAPDLRSGKQQAKDLAAKTANLYAIALDEAWSLKETFEMSRQVPMADQQFQVIASAIFIKLDKAGMVEKMEGIPAPPDEDALPF